MRDTPHHIGKRGFVNGKSDVFLLIRSISPFYRARIAREGLASRLDGAR
jgi:hypothetical protein